MLISNYRIAKRVFIVSLISMAILATAMFLTMFMRKESTIVTFAADTRSETISLNKDEIYFLYESNQKFSYKTSNATVLSDFSEKNDKMYLLYEKKPVAKIVSESGTITFEVDHNVKSSDMYSLVIMKGTDVYKNNQIDNSIWKKILSNVGVVPFFGIVSTGFILYRYRGRVYQLKRNK